MRNFSEDSHHSEVMLSSGFDPKYNDNPYSYREFSARLRTHPRSLCGTEYWMFPDDGFANLTLH